MIEYDPTLLRFQQNDVDACNILLEAAEIRNHKRLISILKKVTGSDSPFEAFIYDELLLHEEGDWWRRGLWQELNDDIPDDDGKLIELTKSTDGFENTVKSHYAIRTWSSWLEFRKDFTGTGVSPSAFELEFIPEILFWHWVFDGSLSNNSLQLGTMQVVLGYSVRHAQVAFSRRGRVSFQGAI